MNFLGRIVAKDGYKPGINNITPILQLRHMQPEAVGDICRLLGLLGYFRRHSVHFAQRVKSLYDLVKMPVHAINSERTKKKMPQGQLPSHTRTQWRSSHQDILKGLIHHLNNPPLKAYPDSTMPFALHTDAPELGLGALLYQRQEGHLRVIAYASSALSTAENNNKLRPGKLKFWH